ncbi:MAG: MarR family transcriptional regulator [Actinobacteria bacterium]|nr:MarR family transcriptional regulator [Actinomycetota bacterium]
MKKMHQGGFLIAKIHQAAGRIFSKKLKAYKINQINPAQGRILFVLWQDNNISIQELARKTSLSKSSLTSMLDRLEEAGQIRRIPSDEDRRKIVIQLTNEDQKMFDSYTKVSKEMSELFYKGFSSDEIKRFEGSLALILSNLENAEHQSSGVND